MHDIKAIRANPAEFDAALKRRGFAALSEAILSADKDARGNINSLQTLQEEANKLAKEIGLLKSQKQNADAQLARSKELKEKIAKLKDSQAEDGDENEALVAMLEGLPNILSADVPDGKDESDNKEIKRIGAPRVFDFTPKDHTDIGEGLKQIDFEAAAKISGARFVVLKNQIAKLERALANFMLDVHTGEYGYMEVSPPLLVRDHAMYGTGQLPKFAEDSFATTDGFRLISTSEISLTNLVRDTILEENFSPLRFTAYTPCFRSEAGSAGKDTRGMIRMHQFSKVELVSVVKAEESVAEHERMLGCAESILERLKLPYRVMLLCSKDTGFSAKKTYDIEVWLPAQNTYREISSCSNCGDFQARRMKARYRTDKGTQFVHTLNGSGLAVGRTLIAVLENYQQKDGSVEIPEVLRPYMNGQAVIK
ncbi:MAG: serine--tRNA ligase [Proteobacteria bacterium]|nr:serine--tRNA ligase [Pseudomonadota bacterium]